MARLIDTLREKVNAISDKPELILNEQFMIDLFKEYREELPPFQAYWDEMFNKKKNVSYGLAIGIKSDADCRGQEEFVQAIQKNKQTSKEASTTFGTNCHKNHSEGN